MRVYFNIYGENLGKIKGDDIELDYIHFYSKGRNYNLDLSGEVEISDDSSEVICGNIKCAEEDIDGTLFEKDVIEEALREAIDIELHAHLDIEQDERYATKEGVEEMKDIKLNCYDVHIIIGNVDRTAHKGFKE